MRTMPAHERRWVLPRAGVRALPSFHFFKKGDKLDSISGAKTQALQEAIEKNM